MKNLFLFLLPVLTFGQINNKIEGITLNAPCELEYTQNLGNQNNYSCVFQDEKGYIVNYSATVQNLFDEMNGLDERTLKVFEESFLDTAKQMSETVGEKTEYLFLSNGIKALKSQSNIAFQGDNYVSTSVVFLHKKKSFIVNLTTNNLKYNHDLISRIHL